MSARLVLVIAALTLREIVRRRVIWVLVFLAIASVLLVGWGTQRLVSIARSTQPLAASSEKLSLLPTRSAVTSGLLNQRWTAGASSGRKSRSSIVAAIGAKATYP